MPRQAGEPVAVLQVRLPIVITATGEKITADMAPSSRDTERLPLQKLEFSGLRDDMKIIELMPGGGWYTKLPTQVVAVGKGVFQFT